MEIKLKKWTFPISAEEIDELLHTMGQDGWELVAIREYFNMGNSLSSFYTFKREL
ncbi:hypothetical protein [Soonwooa sp.]|uniref:hypothetical protein n=1 Tax=Soonwooa sp. TaxID=1938592 RepID=UPI0039185CFB